MEAKEAPSVHEIEVEPEPIPLTMATPGRNVTLVAVTGGRGLKSRLYGMGITARGAPENSQRRYIRPFSCLSA